MEAIINRLEALEVDLRNKQVTNNELLESAHTDVMRNYLKGKEQVLQDVLCDVQAILRIAHVAA